MSSTYPSGRRRWPRTGCRAWLVVVVAAASMMSPSAWSQDDLWSAQPVHTWSSVQGGVTDISFSPVSSRVAASAAVDYVYVWNTNTGDLLRSLDHGSGDAMRSVAHSPDGLQILGGGNGATRAWRAETGAEIRTYRSIDVLSADYAPNGRQLATGTSDAQARVWEPSSGDLLMALPHLSSVETVAFLSDSKRLVTGTEQHAIRVWDLDTGLATQMPTSEDGSLAAVWGTSLVLTGHPDGSARVWSIDTGEELVHLQGHDAAVTRAAFSPDAEYLVTGSYDAKAKLWRLSTGEELRTYHGHSGPITAVEFSADGQYFATGSTDGSVKLYAREGEFEPPVVGTVGTFDMSLGLGLNMISMPLRPETPLTASAFLAKLGGTMMVRLSQEEQQFEAFLPNSGFGDGFPIVGGEGYIVNVTEPTTVAITGTAWVNAPARDASTGTAPWAVVVAGVAPVGERGSPHAVVIENPRTGARATTPVRDDGRFIASMVDMSRRPVASVGDDLVAWAMDAGGKLVSRRVSYSVSAADVASATVRLALHAAPAAPVEPLLLANFPNPFNPETWIPFALAESGPVTLTIYDVNGRAVRTLHLGDLPAAWYDTRDTAAHWDGRDDAGESVGSGVYIAELDARGRKTRQRMVLRK